MSVLGNVRVNRIVKVKTMLLLGEMLDQPRWCPDWLVRRTVSQGERLGPQFHGQTTVMTVWEGESLFQVGGSSTGGRSTEVDSQVTVELTEESSLLMDSSEHTSTQPAPF